MSNDLETGKTCPLPQLGSEERSHLTQALSRLAVSEQADDAIDALSDLYLTPD